MADPRTTLDSLLRMATDGRGNPHEEANALAAARRLAERHGLTHVVEEALRPRPKPFFKSGSKAQFDEMARQAAQRMWEQAAAHERANQRKWHGPSPKTFSSIKDAAEEYLKPTWRKNGKKLTNADVAELVRRHFPNAKTSAASVAWYRNRMKQEGRL